MKASAAQSCLTLRPHGLARQAPLSMTSSKRERWSGRLFPLQGIFDPWIKPRPPALQADSSLAAPPGTPSAARINPSSEDREWLPATSEERPSPCLQGTRPSEAQRPRHLLLAGCATPWPPACYLCWEYQAFRLLTRPPRPTSPDCCKYIQSPHLPPPLARLYCITCSCRFPSTLETS